ncbi:hypothetical protein BPY_00340 [Bifidobacterium psychraerophilum]|uniref:hypothetical protein n=1 Tax=Bifidobacterium psychraerophilum TaxID=218140 RepID=UPI0031167369
MGQDLTTQGQSGLQSQMQWAKLAEASDIIPDSYRGKPANILVAVGFGASMGLSPAESLYRISVIKGKPTMSAELIASQVRRAGHKLHIQKDPSSQSVTATVVRSDDPDYPISVTRDLAWAKSMGLAGNQNYQKQPMTMLTWRAITAVAREACPEALYGAGYTPDELQDIPDDVHAHVEPDTEPAESAPVEPSPSKEDCRRIAELMKQGGVSDAESARVAFHALTGRDITSTSELTMVEAEQLLSAPELVVSRTQQALGEHHE